MSARRHFVRTAWIALAAMLLAACMPAVGQWRQAHQTVHESTHAGDRMHGGAAEHSTSHAGHACGYCALGADLPLLFAPPAPAMALATIAAAAPPGRVLDFVPTFVPGAQARAPPACFGA